MAAPRPNPFPWRPQLPEHPSRPPASPPRVEPHRPRCGRHEPGPPSLFCGSAPMLSSGPPSDSDSDPEPGAAPHDADPLYNAEADEYADCLGAAARARLQESDLGRQSPQPSDSQVDVEGGSPRSGGRLAPSAFSPSSPPRRRRVRVPWARLAIEDGGGYTHHSHADELRGVRPELRVAVQRIVERTAGQPHHRFAVNVVMVLLGERSVLLPAEEGHDGSGRTGTAPYVNQQRPGESNGEQLCPLAMAALARFRASGCETVVARMPFHALAQARAACRRWDSEISNLREGDDGPYAGAPSMEATLLRAAACGSLYRALSLFVQCYSAGPLDSVLRASALYISTVLDHYVETFLSPLEQKSSEGDQDPVTGFALLVKAEVLSDDLFMLLQATENVEGTRGTSSEVLDILYRFAFRHSGDQILYKFFVAASVPYLRMIWDWICSASCTRDGHEEFFGTVLGADVDGPEVLASVESNSADVSAPISAGFYPSFLGGNLALSILRAGRARALLAEVEPSHPLLHVAAPCFDDLFAGGTVRLGDLVTMMERLDTYIIAMEAPPAANKGKETTETLFESEATPTESLSLKGPFCSGTGLMFSRPSAFNFPAEEERVNASCSNKKNVAGVIDNLHQREGFGRFWDRSESCSERPVSGTFEVGWPPLSHLVDGLVISPLNRVDKLIQGAVFTYFTMSLHIEEHLRALWRFALLGAGDFADVLVERIEARSATVDANELFMLHRRVSSDGSKLSRLQSAPSTKQTRQSAHLAECLQSAFITSGADADPYSARISIQPVAVDDETEQPSSSLWDCKIHVSYDAEFPLSFIISPGVMKRYSVFFDFFLRLRRAEQCLRRLFMTCRRQSSLRAHSTQAQRALLDDVHLCTRIWRFCWEAEHFVRIVGGYEATQVAGSSWHAFVSQQEQMGGSQNRADVWSLRAAVNEFLDTSTRRALLGQRHESVMNVIGSALDVVVNLEKLLMPAVDPGTRYDVSEIGTFIQEVDAAADSLQRRAKFLVVVLQKLVASGAAVSQPHLTDLLNRLNYNRFY